MAVTVSFVNMKGGVGKTTLAMQAAYSAGMFGKKVLAVDIDPQANLSQALMRPEPYVRHLREQKPTVVQIFEQYAPPTAAEPSPRPMDVDSIILRRPGAWPNTAPDLIPSRLELARTLKNPTGKERKLAKALAKVSDRYDLIIIDCPPTESILTDAAYFASRFVLVPVKPEFMAAIGLPLLARSLSEFKLENDDQSIDICGIVFNHSSSYSAGPEGRRSIQDVTRIATDQRWRIFTNQVQYSASYAKSAREGAPIIRTSHARRGVAGAFQVFTFEFLNAIGLGTGPT